MKKLSLLLVALFLLCGGLQLSVYAADAPAADAVLFEMNFDTATTLEEAGISTTDWGGTTLTSDFSMTIADGKLKIKREGTKSTSAKTFAFEFLSKEELAQVGRLKVEYDISSALGGINSGGTDYSFGIEACKSATVKNSYYAFQMCGKTFEMVFSSMKVDGDWSRAKADYRYEITLLQGVSDGLNQVHHVELIFDFEQRTVDYSIDGVAAKDPAPLPADKSGIALEVYGKAYDLTVDNLKATKLSEAGSSPTEEDTSDSAVTTDNTPNQTEAATKPAATQHPSDATEAPESGTGAAATSAPVAQDGGCQSVGGWAIVAIAVLGGCSALGVSKKKR